MATERKKGSLDLSENMVKTRRQREDNDSFSIMEEPYDLSEKFRNMENALKFIENPKIKELEKNYFDLKGQLKKEQESNSDFSKAIYKKVISRDKEYNFQHQIESNGLDITD